MNVYLVKIDNGECYEDYNWWVEKVYTNYRNASQYLINEGYKPYMDIHHELKFECEIDEYITYFAEILGMKLETSV